MMASATSNANNFSLLDTNSRAILNGINSRLNDIDMKVSLLLEMFTSTGTRGANANAPPPMPSAANLLGSPHLTVPSDSVVSAVATAAQFAAMLSGMNSGAGRGRLLTETNSFPSSSALPTPAATTDDETSTPIRDCDRESAASVSLAGMTAMNSLMMLNGNSTNNNAGGVNGAFVHGTNSPLSPTSSNASVAVPAATTENVFPFGGGGENGNGFVELGQYSHHLKAENGGGGARKHNAVIGSAPSTAAAGGCKRRKSPLVTASNARKSMPTKLKNNGTFHHHHFQVPSPVLLEHNFPDGAVKRAAEKAARSFQSTQPKAGKKNCVFFLKFYNF
uniref:Uncharacterized protein n=1 Tax=Globodera pallida TaxID=36090 RepID=A0A183BSF8_GLOPA